MQRLQLTDKSGEIAKAMLHINYSRIKPSLSHQLGHNRAAGKKPDSRHFPPRLQTRPQTGFAAEKHGFTLSVCQS